MKVIRFILLAAILVCTAFEVGASPEEREQAVYAFVTEMAQKHGFERSELIQPNSTLIFDVELISIEQQ